MKRIVWIIAIFLMPYCKADDVLDLALEARGISDQAQNGGMNFDEFTPEIPHEILNFAQSMEKEAGRSAVEAFLDKANEHPKLIVELKKERNAEGKILVFASLSMPEAELLSLFRHASGREDVYIHFRGLYPGDRIPDFYRRIAGMLKGITPKPNVLLDPVAFNDMNIKVVPAIVRKGRGDSYSNILHGSINSDYFKQLLGESPDRKDFGIVGQVYEILEPNLIDEMKARVAKIDWDAQKRAAIDNFWKKFTFIDQLPVAKQNRSFLWDPTLVLTEDVKAPDGELIAPKGTEYSPFDFGGFHRRIFVFDPTNQAQLEKVIQLAENSVPGLRDVFLVTRIDHTKGWEFLESIQSRLKSNVYIMDSKGVSRLRVEKVPSVIEPYGKKMKVTEYPIGIL